MHDMSYDYVADEIVVPQFFAFAILTFAGDANGNVAPKRIIMGPKTRLDNPHAITVDPVHGEIFVPGRADDHTILVFPREGEGDIPPRRILNLDREPARVGVAPKHGLIVVSGGPQLLIYNRLAEGDTPPLRRIRFPQGMPGGTGLMNVDPNTGMIFVRVSGEGGRHEATDFVGVWSVLDDGPTPPRWKIGLGILKDTRGVALDVANKNVIVTDKTLNAILTFNVPEAF
jgi:hypothetical protein